MGSVLVVGSLNVDERWTTHRLPRPGETALGAQAGTSLGGKGANQACAAAAAGARTVMIGAVGADAGGADAARGLRAAGVEARLTEVAAPTGRALVLVDQTGENSILVAAGANADLDPATTAAGVASTVSPGDVVVLQLEIPVAVGEEVAVVAAPHALVVLNPSPVAALSERFWDAVDVLVVNRSELAALATPDSGDDVRQQVESLPVRRVVTTLGGEGCLVRDDAVWQRLPAPEVDVVDTTGAGDSFCGALAAGLAAGLDLVAASRAATSAAARTVTHPGARPD